jgi:hypothetical protein
MSWIHNHRHVNLKSHARSFSKDYAKTTETKIKQDKENISFTFIQLAMANF